MATGAEVLSMLIPTGGWVIRGDQYEDIEFIEAEPITESVFKAGFPKVDAWKAEQSKKTAQVKSVLLERLGITEEEFNLLLK